MINWKADIQDFIKKERVSIADLSRQTGISDDKMYQWNAEKGNPKGEDSEILQKWKTEYLEAKGLIAPGVTTPVRNNERADLIPFYDVEAIGGNGYTADMTAVIAPVSNVDLGDFLRDSKMAIRVYGNSMIPGYPPGSVIGMVPKTDLLIHPGHVYVVETADERWIKRLYPGEEVDTLELHSDNTAVNDAGPRKGKYQYPAFSVHKREIKRLYLVTGVIKRNANTVV